MNIETRIEIAQSGVVTEEVEQTAAVERRAADYVRERLADGRIVIVRNRLRDRIAPLGVGEGLRTKVNANVGTSPDSADIDDERAKWETAVDAGADAIMDLSCGGDIDGVRRAMLDEVDVPVGTVPLYQAAVNAVRSGKSIVDMTVDEIIDAFRVHAEDGADFFVVHAAVTRTALRYMKEEGRKVKLVSRGGAFMAEWMLHNDAENPLYDHFDDILAIAREYDVTLSIGDAMRPGCLADATDRGQISELMVQGELADRARAAGVQSMIEGPGHVPLNQIEANMLLEKQLCHGAPFYVLGPLVTDVAPGYDHITAAIGGAVAAAAGADFLCYVTPAEHLCLPTVDDVRAGVIATRIAAHAGDIAKGVPGAIEWDNKMAELRRSRNWAEQVATSMDPDLAARRREERPSSADDVCSMCGEFCSMKGVEPYL
jgi:phosphomethylpyrimidine synthase